MTMRSYVVSQFQRPRGVLGSLAGQVLARRPSNVQRNRWTVELLDIRPADRVLELGFGPGLSLMHASELANEGLVVGVDHSKAMFKMARRRNHKAIGRGQMKLFLGSFENFALPGPFDKVFAVNAFQFSTNSRHLIRSIIDRMSAGGRLAITFQSRRRGATDEDSQRAGQEYADQFRSIGFENVDVKTLPLEPVCAVCVLGTKAG